MKTNCPNCHEHQAQTHQFYGLMPCVFCVKRQQRFIRPGKQLEYTTDSIKQQRREYAPDIIQPFRKGEVSKEYIDTYGVDHAKKLGVSEKEIKTAKPLWNDLVYYKEV